MKSSKNFEAVILEYLTTKAENDQSFAEHFVKPTKKIEDCITYILNQVKKSGCNGFHDSEIFEMAENYYIQDNVEVGKSIKCQVVVNRPIELTEEEKKEIRQKAIDKAIEEEKAKMTKKKSNRTTETKVDENQPLTLF